MDSDSHEQLPCPYCDYDLSGLTEPRCPECGRQTEWTLVRAHWRPPAILFERFTNLATWFGTWLTILFAPGLFARQAARSIRVQSAAIFAAGCFLGTAIGFAFGMPWEFWCVWLLAAASFIVLFPLMACVFDLNDQSRRMPGYRFWFSVCCYTSAVMPLETHHGPPFLPVTSWIHTVTQAYASALRGVPADLLLLVPLGLWLIQLGFILAARNAGHASWPRRLVLLAFFEFIALVVYAATVDIGVRIYRAI